MKQLSIILAALVMLAAAGCANHGHGQFAIHSVTEANTTLRGGFSAGVYRFDGKDDLTIVLLDGPIENPRQAVTIRLMWAPNAGHTPVRQSATNATIHYIIFAGAGNKQAGIYGGAGFVYPKSDPGAATLEAAMWEATLRLTDKTAGFDDVLGQAVANGGLTARRDDAAVEQQLRKLNVLIRERLGYPRLVLAEPEGIEVQSPRSKVQSPKSKTSAPGFTFIQEWPLMAG